MLPDSLPDAVQQVRALLPAYEHNRHAPLSKQMLTCLWVNLSCDACTCGWYKNASLPLLSAVAAPTSVQAAEATATAINGGIPRCQVEILLPEFWDPIRSVTTRLDAAAAGQVYLCLLVGQHGVSAATAMHQSQACLTNAIDRMQQGRLFKS